ncbi:cupin domain-containing protein [Devosia beringensis]|uniref:cupin domain-containing protein n=1 Tax=Devosia beringensis TaxID=2657486 RepID=UPI00186B8EA0|nr:cupin domain-containing protein [Devosia beringensis]
MSESSIQTVVRVAELSLKRRDMAPGIGSDFTNISKPMGLTQLGASYFAVKPGESAFPLHVHYQEDEIIIILSGTGTYRFGGESHAVKAGDTLSAPAGRTELAHQLTNSGTETLTYICVSSLPEINVVELPELGVVRIHSRKPGGPASMELKMPVAADK